MGRGKVKNLRGGQRRGLNLQGGVGRPSIWLKSTLSLVSECLPCDTIAAPFATSLGERRIVRKTEDSFVVSGGGDETYIFKWVWIWNVQLLKPSQRWPTFKCPTYTSSIPTQKSSTPPALRVELRKSRTSNVLGAAKRPPGD